MNVKTFIKNISETITSGAKGFREKRLNKDDLELMLSDYKSNVATLQSSMSNLIDLGAEDVYRNVLTSMRTDKAVKAQLSRDIIKAYTTMPSMLKGKAKMNGGLLMAIRSTARTIVTLLDTVEKNIDDIVDREEFVMNDLMLSSTMLLGVLNVAKIFIDYSVYFVIVLSSCHTKNMNNTANYVYEYLVANQKVYISIINAILNDYGKGTIINDITNLRNKGLALKAVLPENIDANIATKNVMGVIGVHNIFIKVVSIALSPIVLLGESYIDLRHEYYQNMQEKQKWMDAHVALLTMELNGVDTTDPEYVKISKAIEYYSERAAKYDRKIARYMGE